MPCILIATASALRHIILKEGFAVRKTIIYLFALSLVLIIPVTALAASVHINHAWIQNAGTPPPGTYGTSWWATAPSDTRAVIRDSGCAITCFAMVASNNVSKNGNHSNPYGVYLENGGKVYVGSWGDLASAYGIHGGGGGFIELGGKPAIDKARTIEATLHQGLYAIGKLEVPGQRDHWVLFTQSLHFMPQFAEILEKGNVIPFTDNSPEKDGMLPLAVNPPANNPIELASTPYDNVFVICDPTWVSAAKGGPWITFSNNSKGASLNHLVRLMVLSLP